MKTKKLLWITSVIAACLYLFSVIVSMSLILYGIYQDHNESFWTGNKLVFLWMFNPIPLILSVFGLICDRGRRKIYCAAIILTTIAWLVSGMLLSYHF